MSRQAVDLANGDDTASWVSQLRLGVATSGLGAGAGLGYLALTWQQPHRPAMALLLAAALAAAVAVWLLSARFAGRLNKAATLYSWSAATVALASALVWLDGGTSPLQALYAFALVYASPAPWRGMAAITGLTVGAYPVTVLAAPQPLPVATTLFVAGIFAIFALASHRLARGHLRQTMQQRQLATQLRQARDRLDVVLDGVGEAILALDREGRVVFANAAATELFGCGGRELVGVDGDTLVDPGTVDGSTGADSRPVRAAVRDGGTYHVDEGVGRCADGSWVPVEYTVTPLAQEEGLGALLRVCDTTVRRHAEVERDQLVALVQASPDPAVIGQADGRLQWLNAAGRTLFGFTSDEDLTAYRIEDLFSAEEMDRIYREDMPVLAARGNWQGEWRLQARDGTQIPVEATLHLHLDEHGQGSYVSGIMRDLRPRLLQEHKVRDSERRLAEAEMIAGLGSWEWDVAGSGLVTWSPGMYHLHGMDVGEGTETVDAWLETVHPDDRARAQQIAADAAADAASVDFTYRALHADGGERVIHSRGEMIMDDDGRPLRLVGTLLDITERHAADMALRASEARARSIIDTATDAYVEHDAHGRVTEWNRQAEATFGWSREEALGQPVTSLVVPPNGQRRIAEGLAHYAATGEDPFGGERLERTACDRHGREFPVEVAAWLLESASPPVFASFVRDISERRAAERAKDEFISVVSHELRTPLSAIHGAVGLLRSNALGELSRQGRRMVDIAATNTDRLVRLINDILDLERLDSGRVPLEYEHCDAAELMARAAQLMQPMADEAGVGLEVHSEWACTALWADPHRIEQALTNLVSNAVKFSPSHSTVRLSAHTDCGQLVVQVRDDGPGIPAEHLEAIFERFHQSDASDSRAKAGTGLGLPICRTIVEQHGGAIHADSRPGEGATFTFTLPLIQGATESADAAGPGVGEAL